MPLRNRDSDSDVVLCIVFSQEVLQGSKCPWAVVARNKHYTETQIREAKEDEGVGLEAGAEQGSLKQSQTATALASTGDKGWSPPPPAHLREKQELERNGLFLSEALCQLK